MNTAVKNIKTIIELMHYFQISKRKLAIGALIGALLSSLGFFVLDNISAEYFLINKSNGNVGSSLDFGSFKVLQKTIPSVASSMLEQDKVPADKIDLYRKIAQEKWLEKNVTLNFAIDRLDLKNLVSSDKDYNGLAMAITSLSFKSYAKSKSDAVMNVQLAANFFRSAGAYLELKKLLDDLRADVIINKIIFQNKTAVALEDQYYLLKKERNLEELLKRFPSNNNQFGQVIDLKDGDAKFLPLSTQLIAVKGDVYQNQESLIRYQDVINRQEVMQNFLDKAAPVIGQSYDGLIICNDLISLTQEMLNSEFHNEKQGVVSDLYKIKAQLTSIKLRFSEAGLTPEAFLFIKTSNFVKYIFLGCIAGFLFTITLLVCRKIASG